MGNSNKLKMTSRITIRSCICILLGCTLSNKAKADLGGEFIDPNHFVPGAESFAGTRFVSDNFAEETTSRITMIGTDNGVDFWTLFGKWIDIDTGELFVDFSPKGGPKDLHGVFDLQSNGVGKISWADGNTWTKLASPPVPDSF